MELVNQDILVQMDCVNVPLTVQVKIVDRMDVEDHAELVVQEKHVQMDYVKQTVTQIVQVKNVDLMDVEDHVELVVQEKLV